MFSSEFYGNWFDSHGRLPFSGHSSAIAQAHQTLTPYHQLTNRQTLSSGKFASQPSNRFCLIFLRSQVDLYIQNKQLIKDNLKLQESLDDLNETLQQAKNKEDKAANEQINNFQRKVRFRFSFCSPKNLTIPLTSSWPEVLAYRFWQSVEVLWECQNSKRRCSNPN